MTRDNSEFINERRKYDNDARILKPVMIGDVLRRMEIANLKSRFNRETLVGGGYCTSSEYDSTPVSYGNLEKFRRSDISRLNPYESTSRRNSQ